MGGAVGNLFKGTTLTAGGAPTSVPGMVGATPNGATQSSSVLQRILKGGVSGGGKAFGDEMSGARTPVSGGSAILAPGPAQTPVDPGYFAPSNFGGPSNGANPWESRRSPIYGGM